jgi:hypothetical protein
LRSIVASARIGGVIVLARISAEWLTAIGGLGAFIATVVLAVVAIKQMHATRDQVDVMRRAAQDDSTAVQKQIDASIEQSKAIRDAARVFVQPRVLGYPAGPAFRGPGEYDVGAGLLAFPYRIVNEGGGVALNIVHGIELNGVEHLFGDGMETAALPAGFSSPPPDTDLGGFRPLVVAVPEDRVPTEWMTQPRKIVVRFTNALGERYQTRTPLDDPTESHTFEQIDPNR